MKEERLKLQRVLRICRSESACLDRCQQCPQGLLSEAADQCVCLKLEFSNTHFLSPPESLKESHIHMYFDEKHFKLLGAYKKWNRLLIGRLYARK